MASKGVLVASFVVAGVVAGATVAFFFGPEDNPVRSVFSSEEDDDPEDGCTVASPRGKASDPTRHDSGLATDRSKPRRVVTFALNATEHEGGSIEVCTTVGDVEVVPSDGTAVKVTFVISHDRSRGADEVEAADVRAVFAVEDGRLGIAAWHAGGMQRDWDDGSLHLDLLVELPTTGPWAIAASTAVGDVEAVDLLLAKSRFHASVGGVRLEGIDATEDLAASTSVGDVEVALRSVESARIEGEANVGDVAFALPRRPDVGYDATASSRVGEVQIDVGPTEEREGGNGNVGGSMRARSQGYDAKPTQVVVAGTAGTGDVAILARS